MAYMAAQPIAGVAVWAHTGRGLRLSREQRTAILQSWRMGLGSDKVISLVWGVLLPTSTRLPRILIPRW